jgi:hypothetical protein
MKKVLVIMGVTALLCIKASAQTLIASKDASKHIGETVTVIDKICNVKLINNSKAVLLYLGASYPNAYLTLMIKRSDIKIEPPQDYFIGRNVRAKGRLIEDDGKPEIILTDPLNLEIDFTDNIVRIPASRF